MTIEHRSVTSALLFHLFLSNLTVDSRQLTDLTHTSPISPNQLEVGRARQDETTTIRGGKIVTIKVKTMRKGKCKQVRDTSRCKYLPKLLNITLKQNNLRAPQFLNGSSSPENIFHISKNMMKKRFVRKIPHCNCRAAPIFASIIKRHTKQ